VKTVDQVVREEIVTTNAEDAYTILVSERAQRSKVKAEKLSLGEGRVRAKISKAKIPFLEAVQRIVDDLEDYWPLSDRKIHYELLNDPPLIHASKGETYFDKNGAERSNRYCNDAKS